MFYPGTKVLLLASTSPKNKLGPRTGSIGFISGILDSEPSASFKGFKTGASIFFTRYGFEEKTRCEKRGIEIIVPAGVTSKEEISKYVKEFLQPNESKKDPVKALVTPLDEFNPKCLLVSKNEFRAWFLAFTDTGVFTSCMLNADSSPSLHLLARVGIDAITIQLLHQSAFSNSERVKILELLLNDEINREKIILAIKKISSINYRRHQVLDIRRIKANMNHTSTPGNAIALIRSFYTPAFEIISELIKKGSTPKTKLLVNELIEFRKSIGVLRPIVRSNHRIG